MSNTLLFKRFLFSEREGVACGSQTVEKPIKCSLRALLSNKFPPASHLLPEQGQLYAGASLKCHWRPRPLPSNEEWDWREDIRSSNQDFT
ncbi:hypothetical protein CDAR_9901 [Caerostris darwini]|uniref:Uncharacterized protein n=1 Tax=Caerostris darwini TaxID=1538125 RepID=A0AAV4R2F7_9ARAC|nr:hypothetical protein CDAR_9901 [Caerostris darwini]